MTEPKKRKHDPRYPDNTAPERMRRMRQRLNNVAADNGFDTWADLQRAIRKDGATVLQNAQYVTVHNDLGSYTFVMSARDAEAFSLFCEQQGLVAHFRPAKTESTILTQS